MHDAGNTTTLARYLELLSKVGLVTGLSNYKSGEVRTRASSPKLLVLNTGLMSAQSSYRFQTALDDRTHWGRLVESAVGAHLRNTGSSFVQLYYWRKGSFEVDFVLKSANRLVGLEVKSGNTVSTHRGLNAFKREFPHAETALVGSAELPLEDLFSRSADQLLSEL